MMEMDEITSPDLFLIEHPAIIENLDKALDTLGGENAIIETLSAKQPLKLQFQAENSYQNGIVAKKVSWEFSESGLMQLVFKIRRKKSDPSQVKSECLGMIQTIYSFSDLCDFQYLPVRKHPTVTLPDEDVYEDLVSRLIPTSIQSTFAWWKHKEPNDEKVPRFLPPFIFSRYISGVQTKILVQESGKVTGADVTPAQNMRTERKALTIQVKGGEDFPEAPTEAIIDEVDAKIKNKEFHKLVKNLFEERPMWSRFAICSRTGISDSTLKILLAKFSFYILSGPWGRLWCRFGYDPREHPDSKRYQTIMVSFRKNVQIPERQRLKFNQNERQNLTIGSDDYIYRPNSLPAVRQMWYSICDIQLPAAQKILRTDFYGTLNEFDQLSGWLPSKVIKDIRTAIKENVRKTTLLLRDTDLIESDISSDDEDEYGDEFDRTFEPDNGIEETEELEENSAYAWDLCY